MSRRSGYLVQSLLATLLAWLLTMPTHADAEGSEVEDIGAHVMGAVATRVIGDELDAWSHGAGLKAFVGSQHVVSSQRGTARMRYRLGVLGGVRALAYRTSDRETTRREADLAYDLGVGAENTWFRPKRTWAGLMLGASLGPTFFPGTRVRYEVTRTRIKMVNGMKVPVEESSWVLEHRRYSFGFGIGVRVGLEVPINGLSFTLQVGGDLRAYSRKGTEVEPIALIGFATN